ncbi:TIGR02594 family protein [Tardiphaga robiniae]|uniref:NlpC/P60 family protein n=1 Tax=Tardiphaga robiniae TaxID=943830 RepID=UPI0015866AB6|nr:TIGR02594 family protein [Tardiphaga robiniae]NUU44233.1 TIGR02594 family protein [Tardiphaga robiniae]
MDLLKMQRSLKAQGYYPGPLDGIWGRMTLAAVQEFQTRQGLTADGILTPDLENLIVLNEPAATSNGMVWMDEARRLMGTREVTGRGSNRTILNWATELGIPYGDDDIPWCGLFVAHCAGATLPSEPLPTNPLGARQWAKFGQPIDKPVDGAILVFWRVSKSSGLGHVGFYDGEDKDAYRVLGGNQSNSVSIARVAKDRLIATRWPTTARAIAGQVIDKPIPPEHLQQLSQNER